MTDTYEESVLISKGPCDACGSSDACCTFSDGHTHCFSCNAHVSGDRSGPAPERRQARNLDLLNVKPMALTKRKLTEETVARYHAGVSTFNGQAVQVSGYTDWSGNLIAQKLRFASKEEGMPWVGDKKNVALFGSHLYGKGKRIVITEGELDAMSVAQAFGNKWPAVSLINGAKGARKDIAGALEYLANFEEIVLMFDMDDHGRAAVEDAAEVLTGMRVLVAALPLKDASDCLVAGKVQEIVHAVYNAKPYQPETVVSGADVIARRRNRPQVTSYPFPSWLPKMNEKVLGMRLGELDTWTSGSGMGKTTMLRQLQLHYFRTTDFNQALIMLEEPLEDTADEMIAAYIEKRYKLPQVAETLAPGEIERAEEELFLAQDDKGNHRFYFHDAFGSMGGDDELLANRIRYFAHAHNCKIIWLDHLSILVSDMGIEGDERRRIDALMHMLKGLTVELGITIQLVSHLKKAGGSGPSFEEGAVPTLDDLRGSGGIKQLSNNVYALSRNQQAETETERSTAQTHILKCRYTGDTGSGDFIYFDKLTGCFVEGADPEAEPQFKPVAADEFGAPKPPISDDEIPF